MSPSDWYEEDEDVLAPDSLSVQAAWAEDEEDWDDDDEWDDEDEEEDDDSGDEWDDEDDDDLW